MKATATYTPTKWDEKPYGQSSPAKRMTKATVEFTFKGQFEGLGQTEYLMFYNEYDEKDPHKSTALYVGLTRMTGTLNGKSGSFVMEDRGTFEEGTANSVSTIIAGSGTEGLKGLTGAGKGIATQSTCRFELDYAL